jgi:hypothetical protein
VVAIHSSFSESQASTISITPAQPTATVTQAMIDSAQAWAQETLEFLVANAVIDQIKQTPPDNIGDFQINVLQNIDETFNLSENVNWIATPQGNLPTLTSLGFTNPMQNTLFVTQVTTARKFNLVVTIDGDFTVISRVQVAIKYNNTSLPSFTFTSGASHTFSAPWSDDAGDRYQLQYTASFMNPSLPPVNSPWLNMKGAVLDLPINQPTPLK